MHSPFSFLDAIQYLEREITYRQDRLLRSSYRSSEEKQVLENEICDRFNGIEKLEQSCCDCCGTPLVPESFIVHLSTYKTLLTLNITMEKIRIRLECSGCHGKCDTQERPRRIATTEEIIRATETLTLAERRKLQRVADRRVACLGPAGLRTTGDDVFQQALLKTFTGDKKWNMSKVDFFGHLLFAIRAIAGHWGGEFSNPCEPLLDSDTIRCNADGHEVSALERESDKRPLPGQRLCAEQELQRLFRMFQNDRQVTAILEARRNGLTTVRQIREQQSLTQRQFAAANKRILAQKSALIVEKDGQVLSLLVRWLKALDFAAVTAGTPGEGLSRYKECSPFDVVLIDHPALGAVELGIAIHEKNPSQKLIFTTTCITDEDVVRPPELSHIAVLCKPFRKFQLYALLENFTTSVREKVRKCSPRRRRGKKVRSFSVPHQDTSLIKIVPHTNAVERE